MSPQGLWPSAELVSETFRDGERAKQDRLETMSRKEVKADGHAPEGAENPHRFREPAFAQEVGDHLRVPVAASKIFRFSDGEIGVSIEESVRGADVFVIQPVCSPTNENLMELLIMVDALKRASAYRVNVVTPYFGYARQDRKTKAREPITAKLIANLIQTAGAHRLVATDLHAGQIQGFFDIP
jgi:ribose-phosphate pyrophosphokinase